MIQQPAKDPFDGFWKDAMLRQYILNQIKEADLAISKITAHYVCLMGSTPINAETPQNVKWMVTLGKGFPVTPPQVHITSNFLGISPASYKDYLKAAIGGDWDLTSTLKSIVDKIPELLKQLQANSNNFAFIQTLGTYQAKRLYSYTILKELSQSGPYIAFETTEDEVYLYVISLTTTHFVLFKSLAQPYFQQNKLIVPKETQIEGMKVNFIAQIQGLLQISHCRQQKNEYTLKFDGEEANMKSIGIWSKKLKITKSTQMIESLIKHFKRFKGSIELESAYAVQPSQQKQLIREVKFNEHRLTHYFNRHTVSNLNRSYQKLVEFYSSLGLPYQEVYIRKIGLLFGREDVRLIMWDDNSPTK